MTVDSAPGRLAQLLVPVDVVNSTLSGLMLAGNREMLCFWIGVPTDKARGVVTTVAFPSVESSVSSFRLIEGQLSAVTRWCHAHGMWVLAQVHTHPTDEPHSTADECWAASQREGFLSVVVPFFAQNSNIRNPLWTVYEKTTGGWMRVPEEEKLTIVQGVWVPER
jgi:hypothetical protein